MVGLKGPVKLPPVSDAENWCDGAVVTEQMLLYKSQDAIVKNVSLLVWPRNTQCPKAHNDRRSRVNRMSSQTDLHAMLSHCPDEKAPRISDLAA